MVFLHPHPIWKTRRPEQITKKSNNDVRLFLGFAAARDSATDTEDSLTSGRSWLLCGCLFRMEGIHWAATLEQWARRGVCSHLSKGQIKSASHSDETRNLAFWAEPRSGLVMHGRMSIQILSFESNMTSYMQSSNKTVMPYTTWVCQEKLPISFLPSSYDMRHS
jgi:hypothetical protein